MNTANDSYQLPANWREVLNARILEAKSSRVSVATRAAPRIMVDAIVQESDITEVVSLPDVSIDLMSFENAYS